MPGAVGSARRAMCTHRSSAPDERQKLFPSLGVFPKHAQHGAGDSLAVHFLHPSHYHTHVSRKQDDRAGSKAWTVLSCFQFNRKQGKDKFQFTLVKHVKTSLLWKLLNFFLNHFLSYSYLWFRLWYIQPERYKALVKKHECSKSKEIQKPCLIHPQGHDGSVLMTVSQEILMDTDPARREEVKTVSVPKQHGEARQHAQSLGTAQRGQNGLHNACDSHTSLQLQECLEITTRDTESSHSGVGSERVEPMNRIALPRGLMHWVG